jgi:large repetitive protein
VAAAPWILEALFMTWNIHGSRRPRRHPARKPFQPACEPLEDRNLLSGVDLSLTAPILPVFGGPVPPIVVLPPILGPIDQSGAGVTVSKDMLQVTPGGAADSYTLVLNSQPTADVTITINQSDPAVCALMTLASPASGPAANSAPLVITPTTLTFTSANWNVPQSVTVSAPATVDSSTPFVLLSHSVSSTDPNYSDVLVPDVFVQVGDVTPPVPPPIQTGGVDVSTDNLQLTLGGPAQTYSLVLTSQPTADVTITVSQGDPEVRALGAPNFGPGIGDTVPLTITPTTLTFTANNWNVAQTVSVSAPAGTTTGDTQFTFLFHTVSSTDPNYNDLFVPTVFVQVGDVTPPVPPPIQTGGVAVSTQRLEVTPGGPAQTYTVVLTSQPTSDVTINIAQESIAVDPPLAGANGSATGGPLVVTPATLTFNKDNWNQPQTVTVSLPAGAATDQQFVVLTQTVTSDDPNYSGIPVPSVFVHLADNTTTDQAGLVISTHHLDFTEGDMTSATYTVALATQPTANVTVTIDNGLSLFEKAFGNVLPPESYFASLTVTPQTLTFTPDNWNVPQTVTVTPPMYMMPIALTALPPTNLPAAFDIQFGLLVHTVKSDDPNYNGLVTPPVFVEIHGVTPPIPLPPIWVLPIPVPPIPEPPIPGPIAIDPIIVQPLPLPPVTFVSPPLVPASVRGATPANENSQLLHTAAHHKKTRNGASALIRHKRPPKGLST